MADWAVHHGSRIGGVLVVALLVFWLARRIVPRAVGLAMRADEASLLTEAGLVTPSELTPAERSRRTETLAAVLVRTVDVVVIVLAILLVLSEAGFSVAPLLAGAGIAGIAIGFGAQSLVRDVLSGFFILLENQYTKGDVVNVAGIGGVVEEMNLRRTLVRDLDGVLHSIPNGQIQVASNLTRGWARVNLDVSVSYDADLAHARTVIDRVGRELADDSEWGELVIEAPKLLRVNELADSGVTLKVLGTTRPMKQWEVAGELRARLKAAFDAEGIEIPYPHQVVIVRREDGSADAVDERPAPPSGQD